MKTIFMAFYIMNSDLPNWTEVANFAVGVLGILVAVLTLKKLLSRDEQRESEIESLSAIANQLKDLQVLNERRYVESKTPQIEVVCEQDPTLGNKYFLYFKNLNSIGRITNYRKEKDGIQFASQTSHNGKEQDFSFSIKFLKRGEYRNMFVTYVVDEVYEFEQELFLYYHFDKLTVKPLVVTLKNPSI